MIARDKIYHFIAGLITGLAAAWALHLAGIPSAGAAGGGMLAGLAVGIGKEVWDAYHPPHVSDTLDAIATAAGAAVGALGSWWIFW